VVTKAGSGVRGGALGGTEGNAVLEQSGPKHLIKKASLTQLSVPEIHEGLWAIRERRSD